MTLHLYWRKYRWTSIAWTYQYQNTWCIFTSSIKRFKWHKKENELLAGAVIFENEKIVHTQYLSNSDKGRKLGALDLLIDRLIKEFYKDKKYFDFGISNENNGKYLNKGLIHQKEGFGARAIVHDFYELDVKWSNF